MSLKLCWCNQFRKYDQIYELLSKAENKEIKQLTNCMKPCNYKKYDLIGERKQSSFKSEYFTFSLWAVSKNTVVKTEELIFPISSLVAEFGGTLSLFLGISFMTLWDKIHLLRLICKVLHRCKSDNLNTTT